jgi:3-hydroxyacyl-CoA dehydrogenase
MGRGIALSFAAAGISTSVLTRDPSKTAELFASMSPGVTIACTSRLPITPPLLILETIPEQLELKRALYKEIEAQYGNRCPIIGSNTSSLSLQQLHMQYRILIDSAGYTTFNRHTFYCRCRI